MKTYKPLDMLLYFDDTKGVDYAVYVAATEDDHHAILVNDEFMVCLSSFIGRSSEIDKLLYDRVVFDDEPKRVRV